MRFLRFRRLLKAFGRDGLVLLAALRHPGTPALVRLGALALIAYTLSPVDLIPDIPLIGWLDDAALLMLGVPWLLARVPAFARAQAESRVEGWRTRFSRRWAG